MARYIDIDKMNRLAYSLTAINNEIYYASGGAEDVAPVIHAGWFKSNYDYICTNCFIYSKGYHNYCPNCGAKMDKIDV
ncbi:MAG: hypothetical protein KBS82_05080 [Oscillospiraceae bacterium]|nr:hypothetical protein [Candidatus Limimonas egerieequi]